MKKKMAWLVVVGCLVIAACKKKEDEPIVPQIGFLSSTQYTAGDKTVSKNQSILTGILASKSSVDNVPLKSFEIHVVYDNDNNSDTTLFKHQMTGQETDQYTTDFSFTTRNQTGIETYTYKVTDKNGRSNSLPLRLVVQ